MNPIDIKHLRVLDNSTGLARDLADASPYRSSAMRETLKLAAQAAGNNSIVLITGESGAGKDYLAEFIHNGSGRAHGPYRSVNCGAIPSSLAESELFGHERGAFTGAMERRIGRIEQANGGTLLLNEVGEFSPALQVKLLTFLDTRAFDRVGGRTQISVDVRIMAATNRNLFADVESGRFRKDLFYRLNVLSIMVPPLRDRKEDIPVLAAQLLVQLALELGLSSAPQLDSSALDIAFSYDWPGNVRELRNVLERCVMILTEPRIDAALFEREIWAGKKGADLKPSIVQELLTRARGKRIRERDLSVQDKRRIKEECLDCGMTQEEVAEALRVSQSSISRWTRHVESASPTNKGPGRIVPGRPSPPIRLER